MSSRILLINSNSCATPYPVYPLGLSHVASALIQAGHTVEFLDLNVPGADLAEGIARFVPSIIGLTIRNVDDCHLENPRFLVQHDIQLAQSIKRMSSVPLVLGGSGFSIFPQRILELSGADFGVQGEGERAMASLVDALEQSRGFARIPGLVYRSEGVIRVNENAGAPAAHVPALRPAALSEYYVRESSMLSVQTQRGCAFRCCYCSYPVIEGRTFRPWSAQEVGEDLDRVKATGVQYFFVVDSVFNSTADHVAAVCEEMIRRNIGIPWGCFLRPTGLTDELVALMARAGLKHVEFGTDSFCDSVLDAYGKGFSFGDIFEASETMRRNRVRHAHFLIVGGPGETEATMREGYANSQRLKKTVAFPFVGMRLFPRTPLHDRAVGEGVVSGDFDLFPPYFYLSPGIARARIYEVLDEFRANAGNWIVGEPPPEMLRVMEQLRQRGVAGPMWEFLVK
jgi:radical SAM superfamily enzyme YgiQ (UPF0313 family)